LTNPRAEEACGSEVACNDIIDAVEFLQSKYSIEPNAVFLLGGSGGGHMALMVAAYKTTMWRAVSSWCPITDLALWHKKNGENNGYTPHIEACCGGAPGDSHKVDYEYVKRSPMSYLTQLTKVNLCIHHGRFDKTVPYIHTKNLAFALDALSPPSFFFEIFDGGHDFFPERAFTWFDKILSSKDHKMALTS
jgi:dipeptidyl aminopeptidase/acylaminoacyl peptidase